MKISCLTATRGRKDHLERCIACFLAQDHEDREQIVLNKGDVPIIWTGDPRVRIFNEPGIVPLGDVRNRMLELATGDCVRTWDDDDLYMGWSLRQGAENIGDAPAFKPGRSYYAMGCPVPATWGLNDNVYEATILVRTEVARKYGYKSAGGDEHSPLLEGIEKEGGARRKDFGFLTGYAYRWGNGVHHISGTLGAKAGDGSPRTLQERTEEWAAAHKDHGDGVTPLDPAGQKWALDSIWLSLVTAIAAGRVETGARDEQGRASYHASGAPEAEEFQRWLEGERG